MAWDPESRSRRRVISWGPPRTGEQGCRNINHLASFFPSSSHLVSFISCNIRARCKHTSRNLSLSHESAADLLQKSSPLTITVLLQSLFLSIAFTALLFYAPSLFTGLLYEMEKKQKEGGGKKSWMRENKEQGTKKDSTVEGEQIKRWIWTKKRKKKKQAKI